MGDGVWEWLVCGRHKMDSITFYLLHCICSLICAVFLTCPFGLVFQILCFGDSSAGGSPWKCHQSGAAFCRIRRPCPLLCPNGHRPRPGVHVSPRLRLPLWTHPEESAVARVWMVVERRNLKQWKRELKRQDFETDQATLFWKEWKMLTVLGRGSL